MILVDSSVWIDYFNGIDNRATDTLDNKLGLEEVAIGDLILTEVLQGFKEDRDYNIAKSTLSALTTYDLLGARLAIKSADNFRKLRKKGITVRKTADVIIATYCIENELPLLFVDRDFIPFAKYLDLRSVL